MPAQPRRVCERGLVPTEPQEAPITWGDVQPFRKEGVRVGSGALAVRALSRMECLFSPNPCVETLVPKVMVLGRGCGLWETIRLHPHERH